MPGCDDGQGHVQTREATIKKRLLHRTYLRHWTTSAEISNWRLDPGPEGPSRTFGEIRAYRCGLMESTAGHRINRPSSPFLVRRTDGIAAVATERAIGSPAISKAPPAREHQVWFSFNRHEASSCFDHDVPECLGVGGRVTNRIVLGDLDTFGLAAEQYSPLSAGHPQRFQGAFNSFLSNAHWAIDSDERKGLPTLVNGLRAAVLASAAVDAAASTNGVPVS